MHLDTFNRIRKAQARRQANDDTAADLAELAPLGGKSVFDAICRASDATKQDPQRAALEAAVRARMLNARVDRSAKRAFQRRGPLQDAE